MNLIKNLITFLKNPKNGNNKLYDECEDLFNIKIIKAESIEGCNNIAYCDIYNHCMYIRKPVKKIDDYMNYSIDIINHEFMHYLLYRNFDAYISSSYHNVNYKVEDRKMITDREIMKSLLYY